jgi:hypothetical protein
MLFLEICICGWSLTHGLSVLYNEEQQWACTPTLTAGDVRVGRVMCSLSSIKPDGSGRSGRHALSDWKRICGFEVLKCYPRRQGHARAAARCRGWRMEHEEQSKLQVFLVSWGEISGSSNDEFDNERRQCHEIAEQELRCTHDVVVDAS